MFVAISPAKKLLEADSSAVSVEASKGLNFINFKGASIPVTTPFFIEDAQLLNKLLLKFSEKNLTNLMKISPKLAELNYQRYKEMFVAQEYASALMFQGDTYQGLQVNTFSSEELIRSQEQLRIISGLYGLLRPLDAINPHRLEVVTPLVTERGKNLYNFWGSKPRDWLIKQMNSAGVNLIVNAASPAYARTVFADEEGFEQAGIQIITPKFQDYSKGNYKVIGLFAKKARGLIAKYIIQQKVTSAEELAHFNLEGYEFDAAESTLNHPVFRRRNSRAA